VLGDVVDGLDHVLHISLAHPRAERQGNRALILAVSYREVLRLVAALAVCPGVYELVNMEGEPGGPV